MKISLKYHMIKFYENSAFKFAFIYSKKLIVINKKISTKIYKLN